MPSNKNLPPTKAANIFGVMFFAAVPPFSPGANGKAKQYKCDTSVLCLYYYAVLLYWGHPLCHTQPLRCLLKKFVPKILALEQKLFSENFFLFFYFHFSVQPYTCKMPISPIYLPYNRSKCFLCTISRP